MTGKVAKKAVRKVVKDRYSWERRWTAPEMGGKEGIEELASDYMGHLSRCRTEREAVAYWKEALLGAGFIDGDCTQVSRLSPGDGIFFTNRGKAISAFIAGSEGPDAGVNIIVTHLDSPRLDLKPLPIDGDKDTGLSFLKTHYYGGIKKYQWVNIPLSLHGRVVRSDGSFADIRLGDGPDEPVFVIPDLAPHLSRKVQDGRRLMEGIKGEELLALSGMGRADMEKDEGRPSVVRQVLEHLNKEYGMVEEDLVSSELCLVPSWPPRDVGLDRGLIGAYGQDNRISSYCAMRALMDMKRHQIGPKRWGGVICFDKEETGSEGNTSARSMSLELTFYRLLELAGQRGRRRDLSGSLRSSFALSADVKSGVNPVFKGVQDPTNSARLGAGLTITKYTGRGGKSGANDASAEMVSGIRRLFNKEGIIWQMQETGKVDMGGGGTVAKFLGERNMDVLDVGIPLLSMHSPLEVSAKVDLSMAVKGFKAFLEKYQVDPISRGGAP
ncbi:MAG: aminopeptidase [Candidatus Thermoplasmatota archaeon]|jgi:aspartyl aminopeptidase|nr:aminopeptidase [Candidatus Thermoplasmatota archaeon]